MKNAFKHGAFIGIASGIWILVLHFAGVYENQYPEPDRLSWLEYISGIIPVAGLYMGIKNFRNRINGGRMEFFEGIFEGFKIMIVGGIIASFCASIYVAYVAKGLQADYMARIAAAGVIGILSTLVISLLLMNKQHNL